MEDPHYNMDRRQKIRRLPYAAPFPIQRQWATDKFQLYYIINDGSNAFAIGSKGKSIADAATDRRVSDAPARPTQRQ